jgi:H+/Na+-translocating ferredoxin:NAD+ oxidoreductase subunit B
MAERSTDDVWRERAGCRPGLARQQQEEVVMSQESYRKLAEHLDRLPGGFAPSETGGELRLLAALFTPQEAELAVHLTLDRELAGAIAARAGLPAAEVAPRLDEMARKGLIFAEYLEDGTVRFQAVPWVVGIYEFQVDNLTEDLRRAMSERGPSVPRGWRAPITRQMRTIPIGQSLEPHLEALPYEQAETLVRAHDRFAVAPCICRRHATLQGAGCDAPEESCLMFGDWADYYVRNGRGRTIDQAEVFALLAQADAHNLVLQPTQSQRTAAICMCCGCCCGVLGWLKRQPKPAEAASSAFIARFDAALCVGCETCLDRCQMEALRADGDRVALNADRCIGCGLCVSTCPSGALSLQRKPGGEHVQLPPDLSATWREIAREQARREHT